MQGKKLFIGNFSYDTTEADLRDLFSEHGKVVDMRIIGDKGFGFVEMDDAGAGPPARPWVS